MVGAKMIQNLDILYGVTSQSLVFDAPEGRPSSVTSSQVFENADGDDDTAESALGGSATIESAPDTTFDADSGLGQANENVLNLAATTGIERGRRFLATNATGEREWVEIGPIASAASATSRFPLRNSYASGDVFESTRIEQSLDDSWCAEEDNLSYSTANPRYRWRIVYVVAGVTYAKDVYFDLVRYSPTSTVTGLDVDAAFPWLGWLNRLPTEDQEDRGERIISEAYRQVKLDFAANGKADQASRNREVFEDMVIHKAASLAVQPSELEVFEFLDGRYNSRLSNFVQVAKLPMDTDGSGAARQVDNSPIWRR